MLRRTALTLCTLFLALPALVVTSPARAATPSPGDLTASGEPGGIPTLSWSRVAEATGYDVQVSDTSSFTRTAWSSNTTNVNAVPTVQLPTGQLWFRVRANGPTGASEWVVSSSFERKKNTGPTLKFPADGASLIQPDDPVLLSWSTVPGATEYVVEISSDAGFTDPTLIKTFRTKTTTLVRPDPQAARRYYWRVAGVLGPGITSEWSEERWYELLSLPAARLVAPAHDATVDDVVLDWEPVPGATSYDIEISKVPGFNTLVHTRARIPSTRYSPPVTLDNDQYYWRVRARDILGNLQDGSVPDTWRFRRAWAEQPALQYPADGAVVGDPFYFQWSPVKLASSYRLQVSLNPQFDAAGDVRSCFTTQTTWTSRDFAQPGRDCWPTAAGTYYWRVIGLDDPASPPVQTDQIAANVSRFSYLPEMVQPTAPADGGAVTVPTMRWEPVAGASKYRVTLTGPTGQSTAFTTAATSYTPRGPQAAGSYRWYVQSFSEDNRLGPAVTSAGQWTFTLVDPPAATAATPEPTLQPATHGRFPTLTWTPVAGATQYKILVRPADNIGDTVLTTTFAYPAGEDETARFLQPGDYVWRVEAYNGQSYLSTSQTAGRFTIAERPAVTGQRLALSGTETGDPTTSCGPVVVDCKDVRQNPVLRWDPEPGTGSYLLYLSYDRELTNLVGKSDGFPLKFPIKVNSTMWTSPVALPEGDAGTAYYWGVLPCTSGGVCRSEEYPRHSFSKLSNPVQPLSPGIPHRPVNPDPLPSLPDDITFTWRDYLAGNAAAPTSGATLKSPSRTEARSYRIQVSDDPQFNNLLDNQVVDQTTFTSFGNTYPDTQLYWRVQAIDGSSNPLPWSEPWTFDKQSPVPELVGPTSADAEVDGSEPLRWTPLGYASAYDVEIYRNGDTKPDAANLVDKGTLAQTAVSWADPVEPSAEPYTWRVRRVDAKDRRGDWSDWMSYQVSREVVQLQGPASGTSVPPNEALFSWIGEDGDPVPGAEYFVWERRAHGSGVTAQSVRTVATSYAPNATLPDGSWQWRVVAYDTADQQLVSSGWSDFTVSGAPVALTTPAIAGSGQVGSMLTSSAPAWDREGVTNHYQWMRSGSPIAGATAPTYEVARDDLTRQLTLRITGRLPGYRDTITTSSAITGVAGPAPTASGVPGISGTGHVGANLTATPPTWNEQDVTTTYQWLRDGYVIGGQTAVTYTVTSADVDKDLTFRVIGKKTGYADATLVSNVIRGLPGQAAQNEAPPTISGTAKVGQALTAAPGTWSPATGTNYVYQWLRTGAPIPGATASRYTAQAADAGQALSVRVTARRASHADGVATSGSVTVSRIASTTAGQLASPKIRRSARGKVSVVVTAPGLAPTGKVTVVKGRKALASANLTTARLGRVTVRLPRLPRGRHRLQVKYAGNQQAAPSTSGRMTLTVKR